MGPCATISLRETTLQSLVMSVKVYPKSPTDPGGQGTAEFGGIRCKGHGEHISAGHAYSGSKIYEPNFIGGRSAGRGRNRWIEHVDKYSNLHV